VALTTQPAAVLPLRFCKPEYCRPNLAAAPPSTKIPWHAVVPFSQQNNGMPGEIYFLKTNVLF
jgi:hypothetical protein